MIIDLDEYELAEEVIENVTPYEGAPDYDGPQTVDNEGSQDDELEDVAPLFADNQIVGFARTVADPVHTWEETLAWYKRNDTREEIGFDPDGMCLKVCRTARNIPARFLTAKEAQDATPAEHRITNVRDFRRGMIAFSDDPRDSNKAGHIYTIIGRVKGFDPDSLHDVLTVTNSVQADRLTVVRMSYYKEHWGDDFKFASTWLNGVVLDVPSGGSKSKVERFNNGGPVYDLNLLAKAGKYRPKPAAVLDRIESQVKSLPDSPKLTRVREFKEEWRESRKIDLSLLDDAVKAGRIGLVKRCRDEIRRLIDTLPDE